MLPMTLQLLDPTLHLTPISRRDGIVWKGGIIALGTRVDGPLSYC